MRVSLLASPGALRSAEASRLSLRASDTAASALRSTVATSTAASRLFSAATSGAPLSKPASGTPPAPARPTTPPVPLAPPPPLPAADPPCADPPCAGPLPDMPPKGPEPALPPVEAPPPRPEDPIGVPCRSSPAAQARAMLATAVSPMHRHANVLAFPQWRAMDTTPNRYMAECFSICKWSDWLSFAHAPPFLASLRGTAIKTHDVVRHALDFGATAPLRIEARAATPGQLAFRSACEAFS